MEAEITGKPEALEESIRRTIEETPRRSLHLDLDLLREYCRLTGHDFEKALQKNAAPVGFLMTFTDPIVSELMFSVFVKNHKAITGVIHTSSSVRLFRPIKLEAPGFYEELAFTGLEKKQGQKGDYLVLDFDVALFEESGGSVAIDSHQFFIKM